MRADWIKFMIAATRLPLRSDPPNNSSSVQVPMALSDFRPRYYQ